MELIVQHKIVMKLTSPRIVVSKQDYFGNMNYFSRYKTASLLQQTQNEQSSMSSPVYIKQERRQEATQELNSGAIGATTHMFEDRMPSPGGPPYGLAIHVPGTGKPIFARWAVGAEPFPVFGSGALTPFTRQDAMDNTSYQGTNQGIKRSFDLMQTAPEDESSISCNCPDMPCPLTLHDEKLAMIAPWFHYWTTMAWVNPSPCAATTVRAEINRTMLRANDVELQPRQLVCPPIAIATVNWPSKTMPKMIYSECEPDCDCMKISNDMNNLDDLFGSESSSDEEDEEESSDELEAPPNSPMRDDEMANADHGADTDTVFVMDSDPVSEAINILDRSAYWEATSHDVELAHTIAWEQATSFIKRGLITRGE